MILHLVSDEKFIDFVFDVFKEKNDSVKSDFVVLSTSNSLKRIRFKPVKIINYRSGNDCKELRSTFHKYSAVIVHSLDYAKASLVYDLPNQIKLFWFAWGADIYDDGLLYNPRFFYEKRTLKFFKEGRLEHSAKGKLKSILRRTALFNNIHFKLKFGESFRSLKKKKLKAIKRIDFVSTVVPGEYELIKSQIPSFKAKYVHWSYGNLNSMLGDMIHSKPASGFNVLVGNSATYSNNHLEIIEYLCASRINRKLIFPLNYGREDYAAFIRNKLSKTQLDFITLDSFLSIEEYREHLNSCGFMILYHKRQQAVGNIILGIYMGMKVFLHAESSVYSFLKEKNIVVFDFKEDFKNEFHSKLSEDIITSNRQLLGQIWGESIFSNKFNNLINLIMKS